MLTTCGDDGCPAGTPPTGDRRVVAVASAHAETVAVVLRGTEERVAAADRAAALHTVESALRDAGLTRGGTASAAQASALAQCSDAECLEQIRVTVRADVLATVTLFASRESAGRAVEGRVCLVVAGGHAFCTDADIDARGVESVLRIAATEANAARLRGPGPFLRVTGQPLGAMVLVDGHEVGPTPWEGAVSAGSHRVRVRLLGYAAQEADIDVAAQGTTSHEYTLPVSSAPGEVTPPTGPGPHGPRSTTRTERPWVPALLLGGAGFAAATVGVVGFALGETCDRVDAIGCLAGERANGLTAGIFVGAGSAAFIGAILWLLLGSREVPIGAASTTLDIGPRSFSLIHRF